MPTTTNDQRLAIVPSPSGLIAGDNEGEVNLSKNQ